MNKIYILIILALSISACDAILEKPLGSDQDKADIFSTEQKAMEAVSQAYAWSLASGIALGRDDWDTGLIWGSVSHLSGEVNPVKFNWEDAWIISRSGMTADNGSGKVRSEDGFNFNYKAIRQCLLVYDNIDLVTDMSQQGKDKVKAEMLVLCAYRYVQMFKRYGGVPIVDKVLSLQDNLKIGRSSLQNTLDHILSLCDRAISLGLPDSWPSNYKGRVTIGVALAIKAEALLFAARPLFNSEQPYMDYESDKELVCFGDADPERWKVAAEASEDVLDWAVRNGYALIDTGNPFDDYGTAVAVPGNKEIILAYKDQRIGSQYDPHTQSGGANSMSYYMLSQYRKTNGLDQDWPKLGEERPYSDFAQKIEEMEPRYKASAMAAGIDAWNNPGSFYWSCRTVADGSTWEGRTNNEGCGRRVKFWYMAGQRDWFEYPIYRLAEFHLNLAEAYNEMGKTDSALFYLNKTIARAGLPEFEGGDYEDIRNAIRRERAVELYEEGHLLYDLKHWKHEGIADGIIGGSRRSFVYTYKSGRYGYTSEDYISYSLKERFKGYWAPSQYLDPIPNSEVNKGYIVQNPGY